MALSQCPLFYTVLALAPITIRIDFDYYMIEFINRHLVRIRVKLLHIDYED
jgi:hypothetical protein